MTTERSPSPALRWIGALLAGGGADSDGDGLPDDWERSYFGDLTHGPGEDVDGDGR